MNIATVTDLTQYRQARAEELPSPAETVAIEVIVAHERGEATITDAALAAIAFLHAQSQRIKRLSDFRGAPLLRRDSYWAFLFALCFAEDERHALRSRFDVYLGLIRHYRDWNEMDAAEKAMDEAKKLCIELGESAQRELDRLSLESLEICVI